MDGGQTPRHYRHHLLFFFNDTATTEIYTLSLHDALPISRRFPARAACRRICSSRSWPAPRSTRGSRDRKSTRLNSSHGYISYAVFCLKKKKNTKSNKEKNIKPKKHIPS